MRSRNPLGLLGGGLVSCGPYSYPTALPYTPTVTWAGNTIGTQSGFYIKSPGKLEVWVSFSETAGTAVATLTITIPTGYAAVTHTGSLVAGVGTISSGVGTPTEMVAAAGATTQITTPGTLAGSVATWTGYFAIPTLT